MMTKEDTIKELIEKSGNNFHFEVANFLKGKGWSVLISPYYSDNITDKPREVDIIAEKFFKVKENSIHREELEGVFYVRLFIECKYINKEVVFWFDKKDEEKAMKRIMADTPLKHPRENCFMEKHHYYSNKEAAKLFTSTPDKLQENEVIYKAFSQSLNAMIYYENFNVAMSPEDKRPILCSRINYPVVLCKNSFDNFYRVDSGRQEGYSKIDNYFLLEVNYAYLDKARNNTNDYFLVDIVDFSRFENFLNMLEENDIRCIQNMLAGGSFASDIQESLPPDPPKNHGIGW